MVFAARRQYAKAKRRSGALRVRSAGWRRLIAGCAAVLGILVLAPYVVAPFYRVIDPVSIPMLWRWASGKRVQRTVVPMSHIAPALARDVIVAEDASFCRNPGIDLGEIRDALKQSDDDLADARGASTITQQTAKNLFLWPGHSVVRKALELPLALWLTLVLPKRRILELYLNVAEWGPNGQFGAEAAAHFAFGVPAKRLNAWQAARLAAILPNPVERSARNPSLLVLRLAHLYARRAAANGDLDACVYARRPRRK